MKKTILICIVLLTSAVIYAQQVNTITTSEKVTMDDGRTAIKTVTTEYAEPMNDRAWYIRLSGGAHFYVGENEWKALLKEYLVPAGLISVGHWVHPGIAIDLNFQYMPFKGIAQMDAEKLHRYQSGEDFFSVMDQNFLTEKTKYSSAKCPNEDLYMQVKGSYFNLYGRVLFDLNTLIGGYKAKRVYSIMPFVGGGWLHDCNGYKANSPTLNAGFVNQFKITDHFAIDINLLAAMVADNFDNELTSKRSLDGYVSATAGVAFSFGKPIMPKMLHETITYDYEIDDILAKMNAAEMGLADASKANALLLDQINSVKPAQTIPIKYVVNFLINRDEVVLREKVNLEIIANYIKATPERKYVVCGYADKQTGTVQINERLSDKRAQHTFDVLTKEFGVNPEQLSIEHFGGVDYMFYNEASLSRCAIVADAK